jgi:hypothetical protein
MPATDIKRMDRIVAFTLTSRVTTDVLVSVGVLVSGLQLGMEDR